MSSKVVANSTVITTAIVALLGLLARRLGIPWLGDALAFLIKVPGVEINWDGIWLIILIGSIVFLIGTNFKSILEWNVRRIEEKHAPLECKSL